ncbi:MAG: hypothetical protein IIA14_11740, partial [SAR324 cluster bacterium]|nr:hypothetical protein [SAR324 cluster bacterium]
DAFGRQRGRLEALGALEERTAALELHAAEVTTRRAGFRLVEEAFGRTGVQALEIDAAGPAVSDITNELLETVVGARFTVSLRTIQEASGSKRQKEVFEVDVLDGRSGRTGVHTGLSGGEKVLVSEALKLALAVYNARKSGVVLDTLWRDECDGALDPRVRRRFPAMLRKAVELGGFTRCWFVTHDPDVAAQADAVLLVEDGGARFATLDDAALAFT